MTGKFGGELPAAVSVESVDAIDVESSEVQALGLPSGARSTVMYVASAAHAQNTNIRCVADRDAGHHVERFAIPTLLWTDYPALESYLFFDGGLDLLNQNALGERLPAGSDLVQLMAPVLKQLFLVRVSNEALPSPNIAKAVDSVKAKKLANSTWFDLSKAVRPGTPFPSDPIPEPAGPPDPRAYAYGHDIAELLLSLYGNEIKNGAKVPHQEALELSMRFCLLVGGVLDGTPLGTQLLSWCRGAMGVASGA
ncbi:hypothetical protein [Curtobacterium sp. MCPF17_018]|uniref:hypothetical protein n=1 Tax=Curtobacterium sp. MCPF17_018 TaxID=2175638 RepID=UPI0011B68340|nr:hypothetical protein [Curtobacterium sp. MCPF17_018]